MAAVVSAVPLQAGPMQMTEDSDAKTDQVYAEVIAQDWELGDMANEQSLRSIDCNLRLLIWGLKGSYDPYANKCEVGESKKRI